MLVLRSARLDDPDAVEMTAEVQAWYVELYGGEDADPIDADEFASPRGGFLIGDEDDAPVAMGGWTRAGSDAKVRRMFVRPAARRRGHAARLLAALEDDARAAGARRTVLFTGTPQAAAVALYRAAGYVDVPPFGFYASAPRSVFLAKEL